jgi:hypothetical protein
MFVTGWNVFAAGNKPMHRWKQGYSHSIAVIMTNAAAHTGAKVTFDEKTQEVMANGKVFKYNLQA